MIVLEAIDSLRPVKGPVVLAAGVFDGLHLGHQAVLKRAQHEASRLGGTAIPLTFDPHPARILRPEAAPLQLTNREHKVRLLDAMGFSHALFLPFDSVLAQTPPNVFVQALIQAAQPLGAICVGHDWSFGKGRAGNLELLRQLGQQNRFDAIGITSVLSGDEAVSSTRVRTSIAGGDIAGAASMLGRPYSVLGIVRHGKKLGAKLGFPTANLSLFNEQLPPHGVYAVRIHWKDRVFDGVANLGVRPTLDLPSSQTLLEVHLLDTEQDLYDEVLEVEFVSFLRPEIRFPDLDSLKKQIQLDVHQARQSLARITNPSGV